MIADTENWDNSVGINTPGQAGNPEDPHYRDLFELWGRGKYFTLAYTRQKVQAVQESVTKLEPGRTTNQ
jgi:penicillin amidase